MVASGRAPFIELWAFEPWQMHVPATVMPVVCVLLVNGLSSANPLSLGRKGLAFDPDRPGIAGVVQHPVLWGALLWALALPCSRQGFSRPRRAPPGAPQGSGARRVGGQG